MNMRRTCFNHSETHRKIVASQGEAGWWLRNINFASFFMAGRNTSQRLVLFQTINTAGSGRLYFEGRHGSLFTLVIKYHDDSNLVDHSPELWYVWLLLEVNSFLCWLSYTASTLDWQITACHLKFRCPNKAEDSFKPIYPHWMGCTGKYMPF